MNPLLHATTKPGQVRAAESGRHLLALRLEARSPSDGPLPIVVRIQVELPTGVAVANSDEEAAWGLLACSWARAQAARRVWDAMFRGEVNFEIVMRLPPDPVAVHPDDPGDGVLEIDVTPRTE